MLTCLAFCSYRKNVVCETQIDVRVPLPRWHQDINLNFFLWFFILAIFFRNFFFQVTCQLAKEIQLKHRAPVISITILDGASVPLPDPLEVSLFWFWGFVKILGKNIIKSNLLLLYNGTFVTFYKKNGTVTTDTLFWVSSFIKKKSYFFL